MSFSPLCFHHWDYSVSSILNGCGVTDTDSFYLAWGKSQWDDSAIAGLWETAHFLIHPSFMKWGIGEALFNNEINSSSGDSWIVSFWRWRLQPVRTPHCYIHCCLIRLFFFFFHYFYEEQTTFHRNWLVLFREESKGMFGMVY